MIDVKGLHYTYPATMRRPARLDFTIGLGEIFGSWVLRRREEHHAEAADRGAAGFFRHIAVWVPHCTSMARVLQRIGVAFEFPICYKITAWKICASSLRFMRGRLKTRAASGTGRPGRRAGKRVSGFSKGIGAAQLLPGPPQPPEVLFWTSDLGP